jgi:DNA-binding transcriptional LysR family regulator
MFTQELVMHGMGVGLLIQTDADNEVLEGNLIYRPLADKLIPASRFRLCVNAEHWRSMAASTLLGIIQQRRTRVQRVDAYSLCTIGLVR